MRILLSVWLVIVTAIPAFGASLMVVPPAVKSGEVAWVRWEGPELHSAAVRFRERVIPLQERDGRWEALFGVDVDTEPGTYPLQVTSKARNGQTYQLRVDLTVLGVERPVERLTLPAAMVTPKDPKVLERIASENKLLSAIWEDWSGPLKDRVFDLPVTNPVSSVFGKRRILNGIKKSAHSGTDFRSPLGTPVKSPAAGRVALVADLYYTGTTVVVDHGGGLYSLMAHLSAALVKVGDEVTAGAPLGKVGSTGRSTGPHLHWTVKLNGDRVDPLTVVRAFKPESP